MTRRALLPLLVLSAAACSDVVGPESTDATGDPRVQPLEVQGSARQFGPDQLALARSIPGFGGMFLDADGIPTVYLTDVRQRSAAQRELASFAADRGVAPTQIKVLRGDFEYERLSSWFNRASPYALEVAGAVFVDLDESRNRVFVGVENATAAGAVRQVAARLGIPASAVVVQEVEPIRLAATLRDRVRPVQGGLQINFGNFACTLGFNATHSQGASYITNSHCTNTQGGVEGTQHFQPLASVANSFIGTEVADPTYTRGGSCPRGKRCRYSDSARGLYASGVSFQRGLIAQTTGANNNSLTIGGGFTITAEDQRTNFTIGETVNKVGRTTGWTQGRITNTCVNTNVLGSSIAQLCQTFVAAGVGSGDSGSPVFAITSGSSVRLYGILWGGSSSSFVFSPLNAIERELGSLTTTQ